MTRTYDGNGYSRCVGEDKFDFVELGPPSPILCKRGPTCSAVTKAVGHNYGGSVLLDGRDNKGCWCRGRHSER